MLQRCRLSLIYNTISRFTPPPTGRALPFFVCLIISDGFKVEIKFENEDKLYLVIKSSTASIFAMAKQKQDDQPELTYSSYVRTQDVTLKTCQR